MEKTVTLSWGKPRIRVRKIGETKWDEFATPVEDSTKLSTTPGDKLEAKIEGGGKEASKTKKNTYQLVFNVRQAPERTDPIEHEDGVVNDEYEIQIIPENLKAKGRHIKRASVSVQEEFDAANGDVNIYTFDVLQPSDGTKQIEPKVFTEAELAEA